ARARDGHVAGILALRHTPDRQPRCQIGRHVLHRMHGDVGPAVEDGLLDLLDEKSLAADLAQSAILYPIAGGRHVQLFDLERRVARAEISDEGSSLGQRQGALAGGNGQLVEGHRESVPVTGRMVERLVSPARRRLSCSVSASQSESSSNKSERAATSCSTRAPSLVASRRWTLGACKSLF